MKIIVLTGSIATGKSTVSKYLIQQGFKVIDLDIIARQVVEPGSRGLEQLVERFGQGILNESGGLNRPALGDLIFKRSSIKEEVNQILHPHIFKEMNLQIDQAAKAGEALIFLDIPLFHESSHDYHYDSVWVVYIPRDLQISRLMERNQLTYQEALDRINSQLSIEEKAEDADLVIDNSGSLRDLYHTIDQALADL